MSALPPTLRERLALDYRAVGHLPSPWARTLWMAPLAVLVVIAAPAVFIVRSDAVVLGWFASWGLSMIQVALGLVVIGAALREAVPGRQWTSSSIAMWLMIPVAFVALVTANSWEASQVALARNWWMVGGLCFAGSLASAMPLVALASVLAARAYPLRPLLSGALAGAGAGLIADAGWRMFCHYGEPAHVFSAHLGAVVASTLAGACLASIICRARRTA